MLQEFDLRIIDRKGAENPVADNLSRLENVFDDDCLNAFETLNKALISAPIVQPPDWNLPLEIMCDASDYAVGAIVGQRVDKKLNVIHYARKTLDNAKKNYATTEKNF